MSLRDNAFDIIPALGDAPYNAYYPRVPVAGLTVVCDLPVEWTAVPVPVPPVTPGGGGSGTVFVPRVRPVVRRKVRTCVAVPTAYATHDVRARQYVTGEVIVGARLAATHTRRVVDPLPGLLIEDEELLVMLAAME